MAGENMRGGRAGGQGECEGAILSFSRGPPFRNLPKAPQQEA